MDSPNIYECGCVRARLPLTKATVSCCTARQIEFAFKTLFDIRVLLSDGSETSVKKNLQDFMSLYISTGGIARCSRD